MANNQSQYMIKTKQNHNFLDPSDFYVSRQLSRAWISPCKYVHALFLPPLIHMVVTN